jgi:putative ATP-dependent endonuclease of OLD family
MARWSSVEEAGEQRVYFPKLSDPASERWAPVLRPYRLAIPFVTSSPSRPLQIRAEGEFRRLLEVLDDGRGDLATALQALADGVEDLTAGLSEDTSITGGLEAILEPLRPALGLDVPARDVIHFAPDGGSVTGLLRGLEPAVDLGDGVGFLPLRRHGSTLAASLAGAEAIALARLPSAIVAWDDFGESIDGSSCEYLAVMLRRTCGQVWLSTRRPEAVRAFPMDEMVRLTRHAGRAAHRIDVPVTKPERLAARRAQLHLVPAITARAVVVCEGIYDVIALNTLADLRVERDESPPPSAFGIHLIEAGNIEQVPQVGRLARQMGFRVVGAVDFDRDEQRANELFREVEEATHAAVRLPHGFAIERALVYGVESEHLRTSMITLRDAFALSWPEPSTMSDDQVSDFLIKNIKGRGLHDALLRSFPISLEPPILGQFLDTALDFANTGVSEARTLTA